MGCYNDGDLQAYLDGEVLFRDHAELEKHLQYCQDCRTRTAELKENKDFAELKLGTLGLDISRTKVSSREAWLRFNDLNRKKCESIRNIRGGKIMSSKIKKIAVAAAVVLGLGLSFTSSTVRATASDFLTIFRVEKVQTIAINPQEIREIGRVFKEKGVSLNIENFGTVSNEGIEKPKAVSQEEAENVAGFDLKLPGYIPDGYQEKGLEFMKSGSISFQLNTSNVNNLIKTLGGTSLLPKELDGKEFVIKTPNVIQMFYSVETANAQPKYKDLSITQFKSPEIIAPAGVDAAKIREAVLALPVIPEDVRRQLASVDDWRNTMLVPTPDGQTEKIKIGDSEGYYSVLESGKANRNHDTLVWVSDGVVNFIEGNLTKDELIKIAINLK